MENSRNPIEEERVIVTGCSSGIGLAMTTQLLEKGYRVLGIDKVENPDLTTINPTEKFDFEKLDLANISALAVSAKKLAESIEGPIRALVSNAGIGRMGFLEQLSVPDLQLVMDTNFMSHVVLTKALLPRMKQQAEPADIIYTGSEAALKGARQGSIYCASKFALRGFSQALREECGKSQVRVTLLNPGAVRTAFFDDLQFEPGPSASNAIEPEDVANALLLVLGSRPETVFDEINLSPLTQVWQRK